MRLKSYIPIQTDSIEFTPRTNYSNTVILIRLNPPEITRIFTGNHNSSTLSPNRTCPPKTFIVSVLNCIHFPLLVLLHATAYILSSLSAILYISYIRGSSLVRMRPEYYSNEHSQFLDQHRCTDFTPYLHVLHLRVSLWL